MSQWITSFEQHQMLPRVSESLRILEGATTEGLGTSELSGYARLLKVLKLLEQRLTDLDPELFHPGTWAGNFPNWTTNLQSYVTAFSNDKNPANLQNANNTVDEILNALRPFHIAPYGNSSSGLMKSVTTFQVQLVKEIEATRSKGADVRNQLDVFANEVVQVKERLAANDQTIEQQKSRLDQSIAEFQKQFSQAESARQAEFTNNTKVLLNESVAQQQSFESKFIESQGRRTGEFDEFSAKAKARNDELMGFFEARQKEVNDIFGAIGSASLSGHYAVEANKDRDAADLLRKGALGLMCSMILLAAYSFYQSVQDPGLDWKIFVFRLATVFVIAIPALYAAQESAKHRERERHTRKIHLELASIDAYLVQLPESKRHELKEKLTDKFFGQPEIDEKDKSVTNHALLEMISDVLKNLTKSK